MRRSFILILFSLLFGRAFSSQNERVIRKYENVMLVYYKIAGQDERYEDSIKLEFIAKRVLALSKKHKYSKTIVLNYLRFGKPEKYFISYSEPIYYQKYDFEDTKTEYSFIDKKKKCLIFSAFDNHTNQTNILKLVDYTLNNIKSVKETPQNLYTYKDESFFSIDTNQINTILNKSISNNVNEVLNIKLYGTSDDKSNPHYLSYYTKNDMYYPYFRIKNNEITIDTLESFSWIANHLNNIFIFQDNKTFNCYLQSDNPDSLIIYKNVKVFENKFVPFSEVYIKEIRKGTFMLDFVAFGSSSGWIIFDSKKGLTEESCEH